MDRQINSQWKVELPKCVAPTTVYTMQQMVNGRFLDADTSGTWKAVTRPAQNTNSQRWRFTRVSDSVYTIQQMINGRYLDAYKSAGDENGVVTRTAQGDSTQRWILLPSGEEGVYTIQQQWAGFFLDARTDNWEAVATRHAQGDATQQWKLVMVAA